MEDLDKECKVDNNCSSANQLNGKATWLIDKGIWLGKKAVITGAVISSAPLVLPPLVVFSTLGLACSVPFGLVFATYACTQKIMSKLLPTPDSSPMFEDSKDAMEVVDTVQGAGPEEQGYHLEDVELVQGLVVKQQYDDLSQLAQEQGYVEEQDDLVQIEEELGYEEDEEAKVNFEQVPEEQEMKHTPVAVKQEYILQEKPIDTIVFDVTSIELDRTNNLLSEGAALLQEDVFYGQDGVQIYNEEPLEQEKSMLDVLKGTGMKNMLDDAITSIDIHKQRPFVPEKQLKDVVEGAATMIELNTNDISEPERGHTYQACVYDEKNGFAVLKEASDEVKKEMQMRNDMDGEGRNETQERSTSQANEIYSRQNVQERPIKIIEHSHKGKNEEDTTKYLQVEDALSVEGTELRNEKLIIESMNEKSVIEMREVIVSVHCGKKISSEEENEDVEECSKSQKLVLVAKKVTDGTVGKCNTLGDLSSAREIADECGLDLFDYTDGDHDSYNDYNISQGNDNFTSSETDDIANIPVLRVPTKVAESKHMNLQPETGTRTPSSEVLLNEENIWEQIDALWAIVGYSAPKYTSSVEEIKALYIFTGVEPPASLADNSDLVEINEKLRLIKSVVGVK